MKQQMIKKSFTLMSGISSFFLLLTGCGNHGVFDEQAEQSSALSATLFKSLNHEIKKQMLAEYEMQSEHSNEKKISVQIENHTFTATLEDNAAAIAFSKMLERSPLILTMRDYSGFEKVGSLEAHLPTDNQRITAHAGDIVLYNGNQIVLFYGSNSWDYTRLGTIDDLRGWKEALGNDNRIVIFSLE